MRERRWKHSCVEREGEAEDREHTAEVTLAFLEKPRGVRRIRKLRGRRRIRHGLAASRGEDDGKTVPCSTISPFLALASFLANLFLAGSHGRLVGEREMENRKGQSREGMKE